jgi:hypothetical protein
MLALSAEIDAEPDLDLLERVEVTSSGTLLGGMGGGDGKDVGEGGDLRRCGARSPASAKPGRVPPLEELVGGVG